ncbi:MULTISPECIES: hypothetical protein [Streptomyces]|uniref:Uncharacterized protein n=1 Tax=Streptomyces dengpaensis TaxID=2049881 RepID=A0ABM6SYU6_9ACTN|nr:MULTISPECIES: hypothetical protein [Streptomyces]AVH60007.1 hypothetical protein C4B68_34215 [Streptomyces dengpaensis]PIB09645.1 hypothetical protein B1C81_10890 [Streptomyces sp. HG99]
MAATPRANSELVAVAWLQGAAGMEAGQVATTLPSDQAAWEANGFVQVPMIVGGTPQLHYALREPVVQVDAWAVNRNSGKPPWGKAASLMELIVAATYDTARMQRTLILPSGYPQARVMTAHFITEPRRIPADDASCARYSADLALHWITL